MSAERSIQFSAREMEVLALAWQCMESQPKVDMSKLAFLTGYTPGSASVTFGNIRRKIKLLGEGLAADGLATPKKTGGSGRSKTTTPKSNGKRGAKATDNDGGSPTKRSKKGATKKRNDDVEDDDEWITPCIKKEELNDLQTGADEFYAQVSNAAGYGIKAYGNEQ